MKTIYSSDVALALIALVMAATRSPFAGIAHLQDASWAVFFIAGFYLATHWRWVLPILLAEAVLIDYIAIRYFGVSNYCLTPAYWFIVPSYAVLWSGGRWLRAHHSLDLRGLASLALSVAGSLSMCFFISNASFYWIGGRITNRTWDGWLTNFGDWYWPFILVPLACISVTTLMHILVVQRHRRRPQELDRPVG